MTHRFINEDGLVSTGTGVLGHNMFAYCDNNPVNCCDPTGHCPVHTNYYMPSCPQCNPELAALHDERGADWAVLSSNDFKPRKDKKKGSDNRQKSGSRERNVKHPNGEEHSRVPKGNGIKRALAGFGVGILVGLEYFLYFDDSIGVYGDEALLVPILEQLIWDWKLIASGG